MVTEVSLAGDWEAEPDQDRPQRYPGQQRATSSGPPGGYPDGPPNSQGQLNL